MKNQVFIIVPVYNEAVILRETLVPLIKGNYNVVIVDDCSTDHIQDSLSGLSVHYVRHSINLGQGAALQTGMDYALLKGADIVVHFDADGQHDYREIPRLIQPLLNNECDIVLGSRFLQRYDVEAIPFIRRYVLRLAIIVNSLLTGLRLTDAHNGFRALNRKAFSAIKLTENRMAHASQVLTLIKKHQLRYKEQPVHIVYTDYSKEKGQGNLNAINIFIDLIINKIL